MLEADATNMLMLPFFNYSYGNCDAIAEMLTRPACSDCPTAGLRNDLRRFHPTFLLTDWARDLTLPLEYFDS